MAACNHRYGESIVDILLHFVENRSSIKEIKNWLITFFLNLNQMLRLDCLEFWLWKTDEQNEISL